MRAFIDILMAASLCLLLTSCAVSQDYVQSKLNGKDTTVKREVTKLFGFLPWSVKMDPVPSAEDREAARSEDRKDMKLQAKISTSKWLTVVCFALSLGLAAAAVLLEGYKMFGSLSVIAFVFALLALELPSFGPYVKVGAGVVAAVAMWSLFQRSRELSVASAMRARKK